MKARRYLSTIVVAAIVGTSPLCAQDTELGSRIKRPEGIATVRTAAQANVNTHRLADCIVNIRRPLVATFLSARTSESVLVARRNLMRDVYCTNTLDYGEFNDSERFNIPTQLLRGFLSEAMLVKGNSLVAPPALPIRRSYSAWWNGLSDRNQAIDEMAVCVADTNPSGVLTLIRTPGDSEREQTAFGALMPSMGPCLAAKTTLSGNRQTIRSALAEALYHRMNDVPPSDATGKK